MKENDLALRDLPQSFRREQNELERAGIKYWKVLKQLDDKKLHHLARGGKASFRNLNRLRGMSKFICDLGLSPQDAAILMHAGIPSITSLASFSPERLVQQTGRLERNLKTDRPPVVDLKQANLWIQQARHSVN